MLSRRDPTTVHAPLRAALIAVVIPFAAAALPSIAAIACGSSGPTDTKTPSTDVPKITPPGSSSGASTTSGPPAAGTAGASTASGTASAAPAASAPSLEDLGENALGNIVGANRGKFRGCYDDVKKKKPKIANGTYAIEFWVNVDGTVKSASYSKKGSEFEDSDLEACIITQLKTITFPKSSAGKEHHTTYQFGFNLKS